MDYWNDENQLLYSTTPLIQFFPLYIEYFFIYDSVEKVTSRRF